MSPAFSGGSHWLGGGGFTAARARPTMHRSVVREDYAVRSGRFGVGLSWDQYRGRAVDLDLQAVAFDAQGRLLDAVYYNNLKALGRGLTHSGDETTGEREGYDEVIWVHFAKLPATMQLLVFVVACYKGGSVRDAQNGKYHLLEERVDNEVWQSGLGGFAGKAVIIGSLVRQPRGWLYRAAGEVAREGQHFVDILEPSIGNHVRRLIPGAPRRLKAAFAMHKGAVVDLPRTCAGRQTFAAVGWDTTLGEVDLDVSAVLLDTGAREIGCVFFGNQETQGIRHSGDNLTGQGDGDDETISMDFGSISKQVQQIFLVVNIYTRGTTFSQVANPYCRLVTHDGDEFCRYQLTEAGDEQALIMARLFREQGGRWSFQAIGAPCRGQTYKDSMPAVLKYAQTRPSDLARTSSVSSVGSASGSGLCPAASVQRATCIEGAADPGMCSHCCAM